MKPKRNIVKAPEHKILGDEAEKLKGKLDLLKEQIKRKKEEKQMNKTSTSVYSQSSQALQSRAASAKNSQPSGDPLLQELKTLKMEGIASKLREYSINSLQDLQKTTTEQIDQWKNVPVGYRIKLKKYVQHEKQKVSSQIKMSETQREQSKQRPTMLDIEAIVKNRKAQAVFVPIERQKDMESDDEAEKPLGEAEQQFMIQSILQAFRPKHRASNLKSNHSVVKHVHWSSEVDQMERQHPHLKSYPKEKISKKVFHVPTDMLARQDAVNMLPVKVNMLIGPSFQDNQEFPDYKYCWICLKKIENALYCLQNRDFCSKKCQEGFQFSMKQWEIIETEKEQKYVADKQQLQQMSEDEVSFDIL